MAGLRKYDHDAILNLRAQGLGPAAIAARLDVPHSGVLSVISDARRRGDARSKRPISAAPEQGRPDAQRPGVMVIRVATMDRVGGDARKVPVSLPRLSILEGWTGAA